MRESHHYVEELLSAYEPNARIFEDRRYYMTFDNYIKVLDHIRSFLDDFEKKGLFMRYIQRDTYKKSLYSLSEEVDRSISALRHGLSLRGALKSGDMTQRLDSAQQAMDMAITRFGSMKNHVAGAEGKRDLLMTHIHLAELGTKDILDSVEIPARRVKAIPGDQPRQGRNFVIHRRLYEGQEVAEKIYRASVSDERLQQQVRKQVAILKKLEVCPYIIRFYGIHRKTNSFGLITEFATMGSLKELIANGELLDLKTRISITTEVVEGVAFLHNVGILHKNLKTSSVLILRDMSAKISGFEFSREVDTETVQVVDLGSDRFRWIPPEKIRSFIDSTPMGDIFSLGMTLWSLWTGKYPYSHLPDRASVESHVLRGGREDCMLLPLTVRSFVEQCFHENPDKRPTAAELINGLDYSFPKEFDQDSLRDKSPRCSPRCLDSPESSDYGHDSPTDSVGKSLSSLKLGRTTDPSPTNENASKSASSLHSRSAQPLRDRTLSRPDSSLWYNSVSPAASTHKADSLARRGPKLNTQFQESALGSADVNDVNGLTHLFSSPLPTLEAAVADHNQARYREAFDKFMILQQSGIARAEYFLGYYYFWGQEGVVSKDLRRAIDHLARAADAGDSDALDLLGMVYRDPANPAADPAKALIYFQRAANLGNRKAYYHLFAAYAQGKVTAQDLNKAREMLLASARLGYPSAIQQATRLGYGSQI